MDLSTPYDPENVFAKILRGDIPAAVIAETDDTLAFMDAFPQTKGHSLVIPKSQATNLLEIGEAPPAALLAETQRIARAVHRALQPDGIRLMQFNGSAAGQSVFHIHFHILPIWADQAPGPHGQGQADPETLSALAEDIRAAL